MNRVTNKILNSYLKTKKIENASSFLTYIQTTSHLKDFIKYCSKHKVHIDMKNGSDTVLFHGSNKPASVLNPQRSLAENGELEKDALLYSTSNSNYAIFLAILNLNDATAGVVISNKKTMLTIDTEFVNGGSTLKNGYVHVLSNNDFKKLGNDEFASTKETPVLFTIPVTPSDLSIPILIKTS